jgi:hypothetical protein
MARGEPLESGGILLVPHDALGTSPSRRLFKMAPRGQFLLCHPEIPSPKCKALAAHAWDSRAPQCGVQPEMGARSAPAWAVAREEGAAPREPGPSMGWRRAPDRSSCSAGVRGPLRMHPPCSLVEQGWLGWADNGGPARCGRGSSAAERIETDGKGRG